MVTIHKTQTANGILLNNENYTETIEMKNQILQFIYKMIFV